MVAIVLILYVNIDRYIKLYDFKFNILVSYNLYIGTIVASAYKSDILENNSFIFCQMYYYFLFSIYFYINFVSTSYSS